MNISAVQKAYRRYARFYDAVFGHVLQQGRALAIKALNGRPGEAILEVGVGTGLSLPLYAGGVRVTGIDISNEMLDKARECVAQYGLGHVEALLEMDAEHMRFPDNSFDKVVAMYVVSVSPNPVQLIDEMRRVCKPGGEIFIVNHFRSRNPIVRLFEQVLAPLSQWLGFRPDMDLDSFIRAARLDVIEVRGANLFGYWKILRCRNRNPISTPDAMVTDIVTG